jgi:hypothetical protein
LKNRKLKNVYGFSEPDLEANQHGEITARQVAILHGARSHSQIGAAVLFFLFLGGVLLSAYQMYGFFRNPVGTFPSLWLVLFVLAGALMFIIPIVSRRETDNLDKDIAEGRIEHMAGNASRRKRVVRTRYGNQTFYYVSVGTFNMGAVSEDIYDAYLNDHCYRVYFLPISKRVIAVEMIDPSEINAPLKAKNKVAPEPEYASESEVKSEKETTFLVYSLRGNGTYNASIKWYFAEDQPPKIAWQAQGDDALALHQQASQRLPNVETNMQKRGWQITKQKEEGAVSANASFRRVYTLERSKSEVELLNR